MIELLMVTHNRLEYLKKALPSVMSQTQKDIRLNIWDNASGPETVDWLKQIRNRRVRIHFHDSNVSLAHATTKAFLEFDTEFVGKVDPDTVVPRMWAQRLIEAHEAYHFGFIGGFHFLPEDLNNIRPNIETFGGIKVWRKHHIGGCAYIIRRADFKGYDGAGVMGLSEYQAEMGFVNGYIWDPPIWVDHMEDARSKHYINTKEYNDYKVKTRGCSLERYQMGIINPSYMRENTL